MAENVPYLMPILCESCRATYGEAPAAAEFETAGDTLGNVRNETNTLLLMRKLGAKVDRKVYVMLLVAKNEKRL